MLKIHYPHYADPKNKPNIIRKWQEVRWTKCPIINSTVEEKQYRGTFVEYTYVNKKNKTVHVEELCILVEWL